MPKISLCVPTYNRADLLVQCVSTLLEQTAQDFEVVVVDDCSTDETTTVVGQFAGDPRFRFFRNASNLGQQGNENRCLEVARGEYIAICHDDDFYVARFAEACGAFLDAHPSVGFVHCGYHVTDTAGVPISRFLAYPTDRVIAAEKSFVEFLWQSHNVAFSTVMARRRAYDAVGGFRDGFICGDYDMWLRMAFRFDVGYVSQPLVYYRTHDGSVSRAVPLRRWYDEHVTIIDDALAMAAEKMPALVAQRDAIVGQTRTLWVRRGLREAMSRASCGNMAGAREYLEVAGAMAVTPSLRIQAWVTRMLLSPTGVMFLECLRPAVIRARHALSAGYRASPDSGR
jgi:GT2 family glycosyltransferase